MRILLGPRFTLELAPVTVVTRGQEEVRLICEVSTGGVTHMMLTLTMIRWSVSQAVSWAGTERESSSRLRDTEEGAGPTQSIAPSAIKTFTGETFKRLVSNSVHKN